MRKRAITTAASITAGLLLVPAVAHADQSAARSAHGSAEPTPVGHTFLVRVDSGLVAEQAFSADGKEVRVTVVDSGSTTVPVGFDETVPVFIGRVAAGVYQVSWIEKDGVELSNTQNLNRGTEKVFYSYTGGDGARQGSEHDGTLRQIS